LQYFAAVKADPEAAPLFDNNLDEALKITAENNKAKLALAYEEAYNAEEMKRVDSELKQQTQLADFVATMETLTTPPAKVVEQVETVEETVQVQEEDPWTPEDQPFLEFAEQFSTEVQRPKPEVEKNFRTASTTLASNIYGGMSRVKLQKDEEEGRAKQAEQRVEKLGLRQKYIPGAK